ncbi:hypothetical protein [Calditerricola satsumensis]|uniref:Uncharacterized protein n=1 Tax=Calditerricola satsumensis TaxID=373054 RepID=A0A8J3BGG7_9BACI|nr:hypothetical protein [Calditerricola satsumensis]GGK07528.1 hypothetical protein GCM10007043_21930 [Calditerricola satsumensis]
MRRKTNSLLLAVFLVLAVAFVPSHFALAVPSNAALSNEEDPWGQKEVLNYLLWTADEKLEADVKKLQSDLGLTDEQMEKLKELALQEHQQVVKTKHHKNTAVFNQNVNEIFAGIDKEVKVLLGKKYNEFRKWIKAWWKDEKTYRLNWLAEKRKKAKEEIGIMATDDRELVYATQYNGYTENEIALPDKYVKFANLGRWGNIPDTIEPYYKNPPYTANVYYEPTNKAVLDVLVREVGPWNEDDNYWDAADDANPRRKFTDLALGEPEAEAAYFRGYNGGKDQFGRTVTNPAGVDLTPQVAAKLGLGYLQNAWVWVRYSDLP